MYYNIPHGKYGQTFEEISILFPFSLTGTTIKILLHPTEEEYTIANGKLQIDPSESKRLKILSHSITLKPMRYKYELIITRSGETKTYIKGNFNINV
jgi:hypothetical protein